MSTHLRHRRHHKSSCSYSRFDMKTIVNSILLVLFTLLAGTAAYLMCTNSILAFRHLNTIYTVLLVTVFLISLALIVRKKGKVVVTTLLVILSIVTTISPSAFKSLIDVANDMNKSAPYSGIEMNVVVPADSSTSDVTELPSVQTPTNVGDSNTDALIPQVRSDKSIDLATETVDSYQAVYENLINGSSQAIVLNSAYPSLFELPYDDYESNLKTIYTYKIKKSALSEAKSSDANVFSIYISGIDIYGPIPTASRLDVDIISTANMNAHKISMTTIPRDSYAQIPDGGTGQYDKPTHAGIYGAETPKKTLEGLYGTDIDYYARINFTSSVSPTDAIGSITVYNDQALTGLHDNYNLEVGNVNLSSGEEASGFVRGRYSLTNSDHDHGDDQLKVIQAITNRLTSFSLISNYSTVIPTLQNSVQTDMSLDAMMSLANAWLDSGKKFTITSQEVANIGSTGELTSYAMPTASLCMIQLDDASVVSASQAIKDVTEGKQMTDIHSYTVFDVDGGPTIIEENLVLIGESYCRGMRTVASTYPLYASPSPRDS